MAYSEEYLDLMAEARQAIEQLLSDSTQSSWLKLRKGLRELESVIELNDVRTKLQRVRDEGERKDADRQERLDTWDGRKARWRRKPSEAQERLVLEALGEKRLSIGEIRVRVNDLLFPELPDPDDQGGTVSSEELRSVLNGLLAAGQLDRVRGRVGSSSRMAWQWFATRDLGGSIAELERAYHDDNGAGA